MPIYEYRCEKCGHTFTIKMSMTEHEAGNIACPACRGKRILPQFSTFYAKTSKKS